ncbi:hypothetical protein GCM10010502_65470 [Kitasatospora aureofaciens]|uniref:Uncharacterized protein n=1 Tax=Kitasatospora aureofaciens TaxID=1894 RepID=A0A8H9HYA8_KITAU|nr:hypothetical protein GCM10010502_65470 [Kitasatospora aureofaciens]
MPSTATSDGAPPWPGEFLNGSNWGHERGLAGTIQQEITPAWPLLRAGAFGGDPRRATTAYNRLVQWRQQNHRGF